MPNLTPEKETEILAALKTKFEAVSGVDNVLIENPLIDSKQDAVEKLTVQNVDDESEVKYLYLSFAGFEDSLTDGCDDNPVVYLNYNAHLFWQYKEKRSNNTSSENDFKKLVISLRNKFLETENNARSLAANSEHLPLKQNDFIILDDDPLTGSYGFFVDLICKVEIS